MEEEEFQTRESSFPIMLLLGLPITKCLVSSLLHEIVALSCLYPEHGLLLYETRKELEKCQKCMETRRACLNQATLEPDPIEDLLVRNKLEYMDIAIS
jgi:hypothetical protein